MTAATVVQRLARAVAENYQVIESATLMVVMGNRARYGGRNDGCAGGLNYLCPQAESCQAGD